VFIFVSLLSEKFVLSNSMALKAKLTGEPENDFYKLSGSQGGEFKEINLRNRSNSRNRSIFLPQSLRVSDIGNHQKRCLIQADGAIIERLQQPQIY